MKNNKKLIKLALASTFLATAIVIPFLTGQIPQLGSMLCPMHFPVLICGYICGGGWGLVVGFAAPLIRSLLFGLPTLFPSAVAMAFELATYGLIAGILYNLFPKKNNFIYVSQIISMVIGRLVWGLVQFICTGLDISKFGFTVFITSSVTNAIPGIVLQIILVPVIVILLNKVKFIRKINE